MIDGALSSTTTSLKRVDIINTAMKEVYNEYWTTGYKEFNYKRHRPVFGLLVSSSLIGKVPDIMVDIATVRGKHKAPKLSKKNT